MKMFWVKIAILSYLGLFLVIPITFGLCKNGKLAKKCILPRFSQLSNSGFKLQLTFQKKCNLYGIGMLV